MQERANAVDEPGVIAGEQLEREQRRPTASRALVFEPSPQELGLLPEAELPDRAIRDRALPVVGRSRAALDLVLPLRPQRSELLLAAPLGQSLRLRSR